MNKQMSASAGHVATSYYLKFHFLNISSLTTTIAVVKIKVSKVAKVFDSDRQITGTFIMKFVRSNNPEVFYPRSALLSGLFPSDFTFSSEIV